MRGGFLIKLLFNRLNVKAMTLNRTQFYRVIKKWIGADNDDYRDGNTYVVL